MGRRVSGTSSAWRSASAVARDRVGQALPPFPWGCLGGPGGQGRGDEGREGVGAGWVEPVELGPAGGQERAAYPGGFGHLASAHRDCHRASAPGQRIQHCHLRPVPCLARSASVWRGGGREPTSHRSSFRRGRATTGGVGPAGGDGVPGLGARRGSRGRERGGVRGQASGRWASCSSSAICAMRRRVSWISSAARSP